MLIRTLLLAIMVLSCSSCWDRVEAQKLTPYADCATLEPDAYNEMNVVLTWVNWDFNPVTTMIWVRLHDAPDYVCFTEWEGKWYFDRDQLKLRRMISS